MGGVLVPPPWSFSWDQIPIGGCPPMWGGVVQNDSAMTSSSRALCPLPPALARLLCLRACSLSHQPSDTALPAPPNRSEPRRAAPFAVHSCARLPSPA
jgi:hypothetical protein